MRKKSVLLVHLKLVLRSLPYDGYEFGGVKHASAARVSGFQVQKLVFFEWHACKGLEDQSMRLFRRLVLRLHLF